MGVAFADIDGDGLTDIFVANDSVRNFLFRNQGDGTFQEIGLEAGVALRDDGFAIAGMGGDFRDFDNDGNAGPGGFRNSQRLVSTVPQSRERAACLKISRSAPAC